MNRRQDIELLRVISAFGIIWFHTTTYGAATAYGGLIAFLILSIFLGGKSGAPDVDTLRRRASRLLVPWFVWFVVYGALNARHGESIVPLEQGLASGIMAGPSIHLWYLPFIFLALVALDLVRAHVRPRTLAYASAAAALIIVATAPWWRPHTLAMPYPLLQWADASGPVLVGVFLLCAAAIPRSHRNSIAVLLVLCAIGVATSNSIGISYAVGFFACMLISSNVLERRITVHVAPLSEATFGIYLSHILVYRALLKYTNVSGELMPVAIFLVCAAVVITLRKLAPRVAGIWS